MVSLLENIKNSWLSFGLGYVHIIVLYIALVWIFLYKKEKKKNNLYQFTLWGIFMVLGLQVVSLLLLKRGTMPKMYYLIPYALVIAYTGVEVCEQIKLRKNKWILIVLYAIIIQAGICLEYTGDFFLANYNIEKISSTVIRMAECIECIPMEESAYLYAPEEIASQIQEQDVRIRVAYGENYTYYESNVKLLLEAMEQYNCNCLVVKEQYDDEEYIKENGYELIIIFDGYSLYTREEK